MVARATTTNPLPGFLMPGAIKPNRPLERFMARAIIMTVKLPTYRFKECREIVSTFLEEI